MHFFVPYDGSTRARSATIEACRMAQPDDTVFVMSAILVPERYAVDVMPGVVWKQTCDAERRLRQASALVARSAFPSVSVRYVRVQARDYPSAIVAGARHYDAQLILFAHRMRGVGRFIARYGVVNRVARNVGCGVRVVPVSAVGEALEGMSASVPFAPLLRGTHLPFHGA